MTFVHYLINTSVTSKSSGLQQPQSPVLPVDLGCGGFEEAADPGGGVDVRRRAGPLAQVPGGAVHEGGLFLLLLQPQHRHKGLVVVEAASLTHHGHGIGCEHVGVHHGGRTPALGVCRGEGGGEEEAGQQHGRGGGGLGTGPAAPPALVITSPASAATCHV